MDRESRIADIAAELAGHGPHAAFAALNLIEDLQRHRDLDDAGRWQEARLILEAMDLVRLVYVRDALGEFEPGA